MQFTVLTLFPQIIEDYTKHSIIKRAIEAERIFVNAVNIRDFADNKHNQVDDYPFGGGKGMLMMAPPVIRSIRSVKQEDAHVILVGPKGTVFNQDVCVRLAKHKQLIFVCGHYEGIDHRVMTEIDEEISIGDYILTGGELASLVMIDAVSRYQDGVIHQDSLQDSFSNGLLEHPQYTRPREFEGLEVPEVLLNGHHKNITEYQMIESLRMTYRYRKDLLEKKELSDYEQGLLDKIIENESKL